MYDLSTLLNKIKTSSSPYLDVQGVFLSTTSSMYTQGVFPPQVGTIGHVGCTTFHLLKVFVNAGIWQFGTGMKIMQMSEPVR
jgi:hypothetical protein